MSQRTHRPFHTHSIYVLVKCPCPLILANARHGARRLFFGRRAGCLGRSRRRSRWGGGRCPTLTKSLVDHTTKSFFLTFIAALCSRKARTPLCLRLVRTALQRLGVPWLQFLWLAIRARRRDPRARRLQVQQTQRRCADRQCLEGHTPPQRRLELLAATAPQLDGRIRQRSRREQSAYA